MTKMYKSGIVTFERDKFSLKDNPSGDVTFMIASCWKVRGYNWPVRYNPEKVMDVRDWCAKYAPNAHLCNSTAHAILFKDEGTSVAFKLVFSE